MSMSKQLRTYPHSPPPPPTQHELQIITKWLLLGWRGGGVGAQLLVTDIEQNVL